MEEGQGQSTGLQQMRSPLRILVVEDSDVLRMIFGTILGHEHIIESAPSVKEGWEKYLSFEPDIVFLDIRLPDGSGHDLAHKIKAENARAFVVMATVSKYSEDREEAAYNHVDDYLVKPFGKKDIDAIVDRFWKYRSL